MRDRTSYLFWEHDLRAMLEAYERKMLDEIDNIDGNRLLNTSAEDLCDYLERKYEISVPQLKEDAITVDQDERQVDVSQEPFRAIWDRSQPFYI